MRASARALTDPKPPRIRGPHHRGVAFEKHSPASRVRVLLDELYRTGNDRLFEISDALNDAVHDDDAGVLPPHVREAATAIDTLCAGLLTHRRAIRGGKR
jgi:hypothetical protein